MPSINASKGADGVRSGVSTVGFGTDHATRGEQAECGDGIQDGNHQLLAVGRVEKNQFELFPSQVGESLEHIRPNKSSLSLHAARIDVGGDDSGGLRPLVDKNGRSGAAAQRFEGQRATAGKEIENVHFSKRTESAGEHAEHSFANPVGGWPDVGAGQGDELPAAGRTADDTHSDLLCRSSRDVVQHSGNTRKN